MRLIHHVSFSIKGVHRNTFIMKIYMSTRGKIKLEVLLVNGIIINNEKKFCSTTEYGGNVHENVAVLITRRGDLVNSNCSFQVF